jgi:hypothetical protein
MIDFLKQKGRREFSRRPFLHLKEALQNEAG